MTHHPLVELTLARLREFLREPEAVFWVFAFPILMTFALGVAFRSRGAEPITVGVVQQGESAAMTRALEDAGGFVVTTIAADQIARTIRNGTAAVVVEPGDPPVYHFDEARAENQAARLAVDAALQRAAGRADAFVARQQPVAAVGSRYIDWLVPGLLGMNVMGTGLWGISFSIVQARMRKLLKRLVATPMSKAHYLAAHVLNRLLFLVAESAILLGLAWLAFDVQVHGSLAAVAAICLIGALSFGALALLVSSRVRTIEAISGLLNVVMLPMWVLSGVFFSSQNFPDAMQPFIRALPLTALIDSLRAVINEGESFASQASEMAVLTLWGLMSFVAALKLFRWQ